MLYEERWQPSEAHAVYEFMRVAGPDQAGLGGQRAILKARILIPDRYPPHPQDDETAKWARTGHYHPSTEVEIECLEKLTKGGCAHAPRLLPVKEETQSEGFLRGKWGESMGVLGGYIVYLLMERLEGDVLTTFHDLGRFDLETRDEVRAAFKDAYQ